MVSLEIFPSTRKRCKLCAEVCISEAFVPFSLFKWDIERRDEVAFDLYALDDIDCCGVTFKHGHGD